LSVVAEFARIIHEKKLYLQNRVYTPLSYPSRVEKLYDIKAVIFDIYGTLVDYWRSEFSDQDLKEQALLDSFKRTADFFKFTEYLEEINPDTVPERTLHDFYHGLIALNHEKSLKKGVTFPEVRIEEIWVVIIMMLGRHGYDSSILDLGEARDVAKCAAYYYNFHALGRHFYDGVVSALSGLNENNIKCGILSNAQFYTPIDLTLFIRDQSNNTCDDYRDLFDNDLIFLSYEYGVAKPNQILLQKLYDALYELQILPNQTLFVGNDLSLDIQPAAEAGMRTAFFTGDDMSAFVHELSGEVIPDIVFDAWDELPDKVSFFETKKQFNPEP
jgi:putative hydrolase of the HAD superfamily